MKKLIGVALVVIFLGMSVGAPMAHAMGKDAGAATLLSAVMPGAGEWYNRDWAGGFPWGECIIGYICCFFQLSSIMDAANGNVNESIRFDFWTAPLK